MHFFAFVTPELSNREEAYGEQVPLDATNGPWITQHPQLESLLAQPPCLEEEGMCSSSLSSFFSPYHIKAFSVMRSRSLWHN